MSSSHQWEVTEPQAPRELSSSHYFCVPSLGPDYWLRPWIHLLITSLKAFYLSQGFIIQLRIATSKIKTGSYKHNAVNLCGVKLGKAHNKLKQTLSLRRVCSDLQGGCWICQQPSFQHWRSVENRCVKEGVPPLLSHVGTQVAGWKGGGNPCLPIQRSAPSAVRRTFPSECCRSQGCTSQFSVHPCRVLVANQSTGLHLLVT